MIMKPKILLATTCRWYSAARLAMAFAEIGWSVEMVGPAGHPATKTKALQRRYGFRGLGPAASFLAAIHQAQPDLIVPWTTSLQFISIGFASSYCKRVRSARRVSSADSRTA